jgi:hypothetical protein
LATASRRAASIVFDSLDRKCSAPCLMARAFLMPRPGLDGELVLVLAVDVLDRAVAGVLEELHRPLADAADEEQALALGEGLDARLDAARMRS